MNNEVQFARRLVGGRSTKAEAKRRPRPCHPPATLSYYLGQSYDSSARDFIYSKRLISARTCMVPVPRDMIDAGPIREAMR